MKIIQYILGAIGLIALLPSVLLFPILIVMGIMGIVKKDFSYFKKYLKIWGYSLLILTGILIIYVIIGFGSTIIGNM